MKSVMLFSVAIACSLTLSVEVAIGSQQATGSQSREELFANRCGSCHDTERALVAPRTKRGWEAVIADMVNMGAQLEPGESESILAFLTEQHGLMNVNAATGEEIVALGVSKKDADAIVAYRADHGAFADFAALQRVPGLDVDRLNAVRGQMAFRD